MQPCAYPLAGGGFLTISDANILFSSGHFYESARGVRAAAFEQVAFIQGVDPMVVRAVAPPDGPEPPGGPRVEVQEDTVVTLRVAPADPGVRSGMLRLVQDGVEIAGGTVSVAEGLARVVLRKGTQLVKGAVLAAQGMVAAAAAPIFAPERRIYFGEVQVLLDFNNDTIVNVLDEASKREGESFAFWEGDLKSSAGSDRELESALTNFATLRLTLQVPVSRLRLSMRGEAPSKWEVRHKVEPPRDLTPSATKPTDTAYLWSPTVAASQVRSMRRDSLLDGSSSIATASLLPADAIVISSDGAAADVYNLSAGVHEFLFQCLSCPTDPSRSIVVEYMGGDTPWVVDTGKVDIRPIAQWLTVMTARAEDGHTFESAPSSPIFNGVKSEYRVGKALRRRLWSAPMPDVSASSGRTISTINVLVHGFAVSEDEATTARGAAFPTWFKRFYWTGQAVIGPQGAHTVGITWPGDVPDRFGTVRPYYPEDEFTALQAGVPVSRWLTEQRAALPRDARINIFAHSLGNMVVNSALRLSPGGPDGARVVYVMNDAPIALEAFVRRYEDIPQTASPEELVEHASRLGFHPTATLADATWQAQEGHLETARKAGCDSPERTLPFGFFDDLCVIYRRSRAESASASPDIVPPAEYAWRWRNRRPSPDAGEVTGARGPWLNLFGVNIGLVDDGITIVNSYNRHDHILRTDGVGLLPNAWPTMQIFGKPYRGVPFYPGVTPIGSDDLNLRSWTLLLGTSVSGVMDELSASLWPNGGQHASQLRQWSELAFWYPAVSAAVGAHELPGVNNIDLTVEGGNFGPNADGTPSHSYLWINPFPSVWSGFSRIREAFAGAP